MSPSGNSRSSSPSRATSFSEAGKTIHLSQPALSAAIHKLEEAVGARLFDRDTRNVALTPVGTELLAVAEDLLRHFDSELASVRDYLSGKRGRLAVAASPSLASGFLPEVVASFQRSYPGIGLQLHDAFSDPAIDMVRSGKVDCTRARETRRSGADAPDALPRSTSSVVPGRSSARETAYGELARARGLQPCRVQAHEQRAPARRGGIHARGSTLRPVFEVEHLDTMVGFVGSGLGVGVLPYSLIERVKLGPVVYRRITAPGIHREICLVTLKSRSLSPAAEAFTQTCIKHSERHGVTGRA